MNVEMVFVLLVAMGAGCLFALDRFRMDFVGFGALTLLSCAGVLSVPEALAGFANPTVHMIAGLFVVSGAVFETGLAERFGNTLENLGTGKPKRLRLTIMLATASLSAFLSSTGTVALMVPVVAALARRARVSPSKLMIPLAYSTLLGGLLTLIATPPNLVVADALANAGLEPFGFFDFTGPGLCLLALGIAFLLVFGDRLLPERLPPASVAPGVRDFWERYALDGWVCELRILPHSPLVGCSIAQSQIRTRYAVAIFAVRSEQTPARPAERAHAERSLSAHEILTVKGNPRAVERFAAEAGLEDVGRLETLPTGLVAAELLVPPGSSLVGKTVAESRLRSRFDVNVMAVFRTREVLRDSVAQTVVHVGDLLLSIGTPKSVSQLGDARAEVILVNESQALSGPAPAADKAPAALMVLAAMLVVMTLELAPPVVAVMGAAFAMVLFGCVDARRAERSINWESVLSIATIIPLATALTKVGVVAVAVEGLVSGLGSAGPYLVSSALFFVTALVGLFISNTATAVLVSPIAVDVATRLDIQPHALLMTVAVASSAAFITPVSSPVNMLVVNPGGYKFLDFSRIGLPLLILVWLGSLVVLPLFFPFER